MGCGSGTEVDELRERLDALDADNTELREALSALQEQHGALQTEVASARSDPAALAAELSQQGFLRAEDLPDTSGFLTSQQLDERLAGYLTSSDLPDTTGFATAASLAAYVRTDTLPDWLSSHDYATSAEVVAQVPASAELASWLASHDLATRAELPDVSGVVRATDLDAYVAHGELVSELAAGGYATESVLQDWVLAQQYATHTELDIFVPESDLGVLFVDHGVAMQSDLPDTSVFLTRSEHNTTYQTLQETVVEVTEEVQVLESRGGLAVTTESLHWSVPLDHATVADALVALDGYRLGTGTTATIWLEPGDHVLDGLAVDHPDGERIHLQGRTEDGVTVSCPSTCLTLSGSSLGRVADLRLVGPGTHGTAVQLARGASMGVHNVTIEGFYMGAQLDAASLLTGDAAFVDVNHAVHATRNSTVLANVSSAGASVTALSGAVVDIGNSSIDGAPIDSRKGSLLLAGGVTLTNAPHYAALVSDGSFLDLDDAHILDSHQGLVVDRGSTVFARRVTFDGQASEEVSVRAMSYASLESPSFGDTSRVKVYQHALVDLYNAPALSWLFVDETSDSLNYYP